MANALFTNPGGMGIDASGNIYVADTGYHRIVMIPKASGTYFGQSMTANFAYTIAGGNGSGTSGLSGLATSAKLNSPSASVVVDSVGNVYFSDINRILMVIWVVEI